VLWQQGESDGGSGVPAPQYVKNVSSAISNARDVGCEAPWLVAKSTYLSGRESAVIRGAVDELVNGKDVLPGADTDVLAGPLYRSDGLTHFSEHGADAAADLWLAAIRHGLQL
jgi:hypothetical protein